jgi:hypothetical protein
MFGSRGLRVWRTVPTCLTVSLLVACGTARPATDPFGELRVALADPEEHPVRDGLVLDFEAVGAAVRQFGAAHAGALRERLAASVAALPRGDPPGGPWFADIVTVDPAILAEVGRTVALFELLDPDVRSLVRTTLALTLPAAMAEDARATPEQVGRWLAFLALAEPTWRDCGGDARHLTVCAEYGGVDIFVVELLRSGDLWLPVAVTWWQRAG